MEKLSAEARRRALSQLPGAVGASESPSERPNLKRDRSTGGGALSSYVFLAACVLDGCTKKKRRTGCHRAVNPRTDASCTQTLTGVEQDAAKMEDEMTGLNIDDLETLGQLLFFSGSDFPAYEVF